MEGFWWRGFGGGVSQITLTLFQSSSAHQWNLQERVSPRVPPTKLLLVYRATLILREWAYARVLFTAGVL